MKADRYGKSPFKTPTVSAKKPVAPTPTPSAARTSGPMQHTEASNAALNPPTENIVTGLLDGLGLEASSRYGSMAITFPVWLPYPTSGESDNDRSAALPDRCGSNFEAPARAHVNLALSLPPV